jgi:predicted RNA-binding protein YlqC (UPF0109 family)
MVVPKHSIPRRIVLYPRDVENLTGRKGRTARAILQKVRVHFGKPRHALVTVREFCNFMGLDEKEVRENLQL